MLAYLLVVLLLRPCPRLSPTQAQAVAIRFIERRYKSYLVYNYPFKTHPFSRQQMQAYSRKGSTLESGYLVMYTLLLRKYAPHGEVSGKSLRMAVFVNNCKVVRPFAPVRQKAKFKQNYQSDMYTPHIELMEAADSVKH